MLIIVDLQDYYVKQFFEEEDRWELLLKALRKRVKQAKQNNEPIINLTCWRDGCTLPEVLEILDGYAHRFHVAREEFDGSQEIHEYILRKNLDPSAIELCGAFKDVCVLETWKGLRRLGYNVVECEEDLVFPTSTNWRGIQTYPEGFMRECIERKSPREE